MSFNTNVATVGNVTSTDVQHTTINKENVQVSSAISHDSTNNVSLNVGSDKLDQLMDRLSTTHEQLDQYTQRRTQQISIETQNIIRRILEETKEKQRELLLEVQTRSQQFQEEYQNGLQMKVNQLNEEKAQQLANLEQNLNIQQENILTTARQQIDSLQKDANFVCFIFSYLLIFLLLFFSVK
jgi:DNA anti-recombination protein RmuC